MRTPSGHLKNDLDIDAWGRQKAVIDKSLFHGMWTYNVPKSAWLEYINDVESTTITNFTSENGALKCTAGATLNDVSYLRSKRNPRYQPNRGMLYSSAQWFNDPNAAMVRRFGQFTSESGAFFELDNGTLYAVVRTTYNSVTTDDRREINTDRWNIDLSKGNVFDCQWQWRGVGNYVFFINLQEVLNTGYLGTLTQLSMFNPAIPVAFECINQGDNDPMYFGCVDITSEGGVDEGRTFGAIGVENDAGQIAISGADVPIIVVRSKSTVSGLINTRDTLPVKAIAYGDQRALFKVWKTRDNTAITVNDQSYADYGDGHLEAIVYDTPNVGSPMTFDTTKADLTFTCRVNQDDSYTTEFIEKGETNLWLHPGETIIFTMQRETTGGMNAGVTFIFAEEI